MQIVSNFIIDKSIYLFIIKLLMSFISVMVKYTTSIILKLYNKEFFAIFRFKYKTHICLEMSLKNKFYILLTSQSSAKNRTGSWLFNSNVSYNYRLIKHAVQL